MTEQTLIERCKHSDRVAQKLLYEKHSAKFLGVCRRYLKNQEDAEEVLVMGFCKICKHIKSFSGPGAFGGWMRRIFVNESLMYLRKKYRFGEHTELDNIPQTMLKTKAHDPLETADIMKLVESLPIGYRTVFNLYVIEGYKHREIAEMLQISVNTSKSQLKVAKERLRQMITKSEQGSRG